MRGTARSSSPRGVRGRTSIERRGLDAEQGCQRGGGVRRRTSNERRGLDSEQGCQRGQPPAPTQLARPYPSPGGAGTPANSRKLDTGPPNW